MKKLILLILLLTLTFIVSLSACTIVELDEDDNDNTHSPHATGVVTQNPQPLDNNSPSPSAAPSPTATPQATASPAPTQTDLSQSELDFFTDYFGLVENNGFLLSDYDRPEDIDLWELFYAGAGIEQEPMSDQELQDYFDTTGYDELYTDLLRLTTAQINAFLQEKAGITLNDSTYGLGYLYIEKYDSYYLERGDTNYNFLNCVSGYKTSDGYYVLSFQAAEGYGQAIESCTVTLKQTGDKYMIVSNEANFMY